jgi:hypothetical protein
MHGQPGREIDLADDGNGMEVRQAGTVTKQGRVTASSTQSKEVTKMPSPTMNLAGADRAFLPWDTSRPPGSTGQSMRPGSQPSHRHKSARRSGLADRRRFSSPESKRGWDQASIAELSSGQISEMSDAELARIVRAARLPTLQVRPEYADRMTLELLAHLACLCCQKREGLTTATAMDERRPSDE